MSVDFIGNFLTIIRNGTMVAKRSVLAPYSKMCLDIAHILKDEGYIQDVLVQDLENNKKALKIVLKYVKGESVIHEITRVSKPGLRSYIGATNIKPVVGNLGVSILTTNLGVITHKKAKKLAVGGEIICSVW